MRARQSIGFMLALLVCVGWGLPHQTVSVRQAPPYRRRPSPRGVNLAVVAKPSTSYVSGDTTPTALNDGYDPRSSRDNRRGSYGNWPRTRHPMGAVRLEPAHQHQQDRRLLVG